MKQHHLLAAWAACCLTLQGAAADAVCFKYWPAKVSVTGRLFVREDFGPPNYGENPAIDSREKHIYVDLDAPMCVVAGDDQSDFAPAERDLKIMQLVYRVDAKDWDNAWIGKRARLTGTLYHAHTGHHWTPVLMTVERTELLRSVTD